MKEKKSQFFKIPAELVYSDLTAKEFGVAVKIFVLQNNKKWKFSIRGLCSLFSDIEVNAMNRILQSLEAKGVLKRTCIRNYKGATTTYEIILKECVDISKTDISKIDTSKNATYNYNNNKLYNNKLNNNKLEFNNKREMLLERKEEKAEEDEDLSSSSFSNGSFLGAETEQESETQQQETTEAVKTSQDEIIQAQETMRTQDDFEYWLFVANTFCKKWNIKFNISPQVVFDNFDIYKQCNFQRLNEAMENSTKAQITFQFFTEIEDNYKPLLKGEWKDKVETPSQWSEQARKFCSKFSKFFDLTNKTIKDNFDKYKKINIAILEKEVENSNYLKNNFKNFNELVNVYDKIKGGNYANY